MTIQKFAIGLVAIALFVGSMTAQGADFDEGSEAFQRGDYATALRIFRQLAAQGNASSQTMMGAMYSEGLGVPQDYGEALKWSRNAADQGDAFAQYNLGQMYRKGQGVTQDYVQAHMWYNLSAAKDDKIGKNNRDLLAKQMTPAQIAEAQRLAREWKPKGK